MDFKKDDISATTGEVSGFVNLLDGKNGEKINILDSKGAKSLQINGDKSFNSAPNDPAGTQH